MSTPGLERGTVEVKACALRCLRSRIVALNLNVLLKRFANCIETLLVCICRANSASQALVIGGGIARSRTAGRMRVPTIRLVRETRAIAHRRGLIV